MAFFLVFLVVIVVMILGVTLFMYLLRQDARRNRDK